MKLLFKAGQHAKTLVDYLRGYLNFVYKSLKNVENEQKSLKTAPKKYFNQLTGARSTQKLVNIHNISYLKVKKFKKDDCNFSLD